MVHLLPDSKPVTNADFSSALAEIRLQRNTFKVPELCYGAVTLTETGFHISVAGEVTTHNNSAHPIQDVLKWISNFHSHKKNKIVALYVTQEPKNQTQLHELCSILWLEHDIVPLQELNPAGIKLNQASAQNKTPNELHAPKNITDAAAQVSTLFDKDGIVHIHTTDRNEVIPSFLMDLTHMITNTNESCHINHEKEWQLLQELATQAKKQTIMFLSATPRGGGVALMRHALIRLYRLLGVDAHWHVLTEHADIFQITKGKFHNVLQGVSDPSIELTTQDKELYENWSQENAYVLAESLASATTVVIDDPQPAGLIPHIKEINPKARLLYRSHIQIEAELLKNPNTTQSKTWNYLWQYITQADVFIAHPVDSFVPPTVPKDILVSMPPTTDPLDGLNKPLTTSQLDYYMALFDTILLENYQTPLDSKRPYIIQIARFDPSKGIPDVIESYRLLREKIALHPEITPPQLVITGHGSIDDPDGVPLLTLTQQMASLPLYRKYASDIKIARVHHSDQLLNALLRNAKIALQLSHKEGFEIKVTESILKGKPVISYNAGGIPLQIENEVTGFVVPTIGDTTQVADHVFTLLKDQNLYEKMSKNAKEKARRDVLTVPNAIRWLSLALGKDV